MNYFTARKCRYDLVFWNVHHVSLRSKHNQSGFDVRGVIKIFDFGFCESELKRVPRKWRLLTSLL